MSIALMLKVVESLSNGIASCVDVSEIADGAVLFGTKFGCHIHHQIDEKSSNSSCPSFRFSAFCLLLLRLVVVFFSCCPTCSFQSHSNFNSVRTNSKMPQHQVVLKLSLLFLLGHLAYAHNGNAVLLSGDQHQHHPLNLHNVHTLGNDDVDGQFANEKRLNYGSGNGNGNDNGTRLVSVWYAPASYGGTDIDVSL